MQMIIGLLTHEKELLINMIIKYFVIMNLTIESSPSYNKTRLLLLKNTVDLSKIHTLTFHVTHFMSLLKSVGTF